MEEKVHPRTKTLLVAEDDESLVDLLSTLLTSEGFNVIIAYDGLSALDKVKQNKVDLIVLDILLPNLNGYEFLRRLQTMPERNVPVIIITAKKLSPQAKEDFFMTGNVISIFEKPVPPDLLLLNIHKKLNTISRAEQVLKSTKEQADEKVKKVQEIEQEKWKKF